MLSADGKVLVRINSTALKNYDCGRRHLYANIWGYRRRQRSADLDFGSMLQAAQDVFLRGRLSGASKEDATVEALKRALQLSSIYIEVERPTDFGGGDFGYKAVGGTYLWQPWGGTIATMWRCTGTEPYKNEKGNRAKCPKAHAGVWHPVEGAVAVWRHHDNPEDCGDYCAICDSLIEFEDQYIPHHPQKNRLGLIRAVLAICESQDESEGIQPMRLPDGRDAVEAEFTLTLNRLAPDGHPYELLVHFDEMVTYRGQTYVLDNKTTKNPLSEDWWSQWEPHIQMDFYEYVAHELGIAVGVAVRGLQVTKESVDTGVRYIKKTPAQRAEFLRDLMDDLDRAEEWAATGYYPMNRRACQFCDFREVCAQSPEWRERTLRANFDLAPDDRLFPTEEPANAPERN